MRLDVEKLEGFFGFVRKKWYLCADFLKTRRQELIDNTNVKY